MSEGISYKTVAAAFGSIVGTVLLAWAGWITLTIVEQGNLLRDLSDNKSELIRLDDKIDHRIKVLWEKGISPLRKYHMHSNNAETPHIHESETNP